MTEVAGFSPASVTWLLVLFGVGLFVGNLLGGRAADRSITVTLVSMLGALVLTMVLWALTAQFSLTAALGLLLMGGFGFASVPALQMRVMAYAGDAPTMASGANVAAFNLGNATGAHLGGLGIAAGLGYTAPVWIGAGLVGAGLTTLLVATALARRTARPPRIEPAPEPVSAAA